MKKILALMLAAAMAASMSACGVQISNQKPTEPETTSSQAAPTEAQTEAPTQATEAPTQSQTSSTASKPETSNTSDVSDAIDASKTSDTNAVPLNKWAKTAIYSPVDQKYHTVYVRVKKIATQSSDADYVKKAIDLNNSCASRYLQVDIKDLKVPSDCEVCIMDYEISIPDDFPTPDYGRLTTPNISFSAANIDGGGIPSKDGTSTYIGLGSTKELKTEKEPEYHAGNTYSFRELFIMVKDYKDYIFKYTSYPAGGKSSPETMYYAYHKSN